ncbi:glycosyltransferase family 8 protein [Cantharellus anzutake]|uniref:glycosyltransferase family 8 protein n=1 Tax=Cantharellus anzutake TaxID=1750568 RepID=UPI001908655D|nr:glycosyltransferase family 8 protein [Cantharellus anzutake]KAF8335997.1 glycosyltransferase family 8 protein [Cantharellus anzutake]
MSANPHLRVASSQSPTQKSKYEFTETQDWFSGHEPTWKSLILQVTASKPRALEIGSWEGRSAVFLIENLTKDEGHITCIDHFDLERTPEGIERLRKIRNNLALAGGPHRIIDDFSLPALNMLLHEALPQKDPGFDWIYIDGSHEADDTLLDGELAWRLAKKNAIIIFDDYDWKAQPVESRHHPRRGIDAFMAVHEGEYEVLPSDYQMILRKTSDMRIGFLSKDTKEFSREGFEYGINLAVTTNNEYAMPASVALHTVIANTPGRISIYILQYELSEDNQRKLRASVSSRDEVTLRFIRLPKSSLYCTLGPQWGKIDAVSWVPVERVIYLDADVLVRKDVSALWDSDLQGASLGAVQDVGIPMRDGSPYFNSGVLLMDLAKIREDREALLRVCHSLKDSPVHEQDALNKHFKSRWRALDFRWNAQGLGTYANMPSAERDGLDLERMKIEPYIVHFTGPLHPSMADIINPWVQPYTAKPWGYAGAPGHPFAGEWWMEFSETEWVSWAGSEGRIDERKARRKQKIEEAIAKFNNALDEQELQETCVVG